MRPPIRMILGLALLLGPVCSWAQFRVSSQGSTVVMNGVTILTLRSARAEERARTVVASLKKLTPNSDLQLSADKKSCAIVDGDRVVLIAAAAEAKAQQMSPKALAQAWLVRIARAMATPPLSVSSDTLRLGAGSAKRLSIGGYLSGSAKASCDNSEVAQIAALDGGLKVTGRQTGEAVITIEAGKSVKHVKVEVIANAMQFPQNITMYVTGSPSSAETVRGAIETALWTDVEHAKGATYKFDTPAGVEIDSGAARSFTCQVEASAPNAASNSGPVNITVRNLGERYAAEEELWYCNEPERITKYQNLFAARLNSKRPVRLLYHHVNDMPSAAFVQVEVVNDSMNTAKVMVMPGDAKPNADPVRAGLEAGNKLLRNYLSYSGEVVEIPAQCSTLIALRRLQTGETMSGLTCLRLLEGPSDLLVRTDVVYPYEGDGRLAAALECSAPWRRLPPKPIDARFSSKVALSEHVYPWPFKTESVDYSVGGRHGFIRVGEQPIQRQDGHGLDGNFGVFYTIEANLDNPSAEMADVELVFEASAGYSGAIFAFDGALRRSPLLQPKEEVQVARVRLYPGQKRRFEMLTLPLSGSSYPATIIVRQVGAVSPAKKITH